MATKNCTFKLLEPEIKSIVLGYLKQKKQLSKNSIIINEFTLDKYTRRVDLATLHNKRLFAFEIKSEADSLSRLEGQIKKYLEYFDKVTVVCAPKHTKKAIELVPPNVAVWEIVDKRIIVKQRGKIVPVREHNSFINLMRASELVKLSRQQNISINSTHRAVLEKKLQNTAVHVLKKFALDSICQRYKTTSQAFWQATESNKAINAKHLGLLSPFLRERRQINAEREQNESFWNNWKNKAEDTHLMTLANGSKEKIFGRIPTEVKKLFHP